MRFSASEQIVNLLAPSDRHSESFEASRTVANSLSPGAVKCVRGVCLTVKPLDDLYASRRDMRGPEVEILGLGADESAVEVEVEAVGSTSMPARTGDQRVCGE